MKSAAYFTGDRRSMVMDEIGEIVYAERYLPRRGWHDDYRDLIKDGDRPGYLPTVKQVKAEFEALVELLDEHSLLGGKCLQLGRGDCDASHKIWQTIFGRVTTVDFRVLIQDDNYMVPGFNTHDKEVQRRLYDNGPYDFVFVDAGHSYEDVRQDREDYLPMMRRGGIIAYHDALRMKRNENQITVWRFVEERNFKVIGSEVGVAYEIIT